MFLSPWRNRSVHNQTLALEKVAQLRERTILLLNPIISGLYGIPINSPKPSIADFGQFRIWLLGNLNEISKLININHS